jgi:methylphosphotriester-DNA--protein-cysteine methyltransferase
MYLYLFDAQNNAQKQGIRLCLRCPTSPAILNPLFKD